MLSFLCLLSVTLAVWNETNWVWAAIVMLSGIFVAEQAATIVLAIQENRR